MNSYYSFIFVRFTGVMKRLLFFLLIILFAGCRSLAPNRMFMTPKDFKYDKDTVSLGSTAYLLSPGDRLDMHVFSNNGFKLIDITSFSTSEFASANQGISNTAGMITYLVDDSGNVKLPIIGKAHIMGMTISQAEDMLQDKYARYYTDPFVLLKVINRHVIVFQGDGGDGHLVNLDNDNTSLFEALAQAGGIPEFGRAYKIKIIRGDLKDPRVFLVDVSSIASLKQCNMRIQSNDIIYVEAGPNYKQRLLTQITPIVGIIASVFVIIAYFQK